jgi:hypothetical protein
MHTNTDDSTPNTDTIHTEMQRNDRHRSKMSRRKDPSLTFQFPDMGRSMFNSQQKPSLPAPSNPLHRFPNNPIPGVGALAPTFPRNANGSTTSIMASHKRRFNWARAVQVLENKGSSMGVSEVVFCYTSLHDQHQITLADSDFEKGHVWKHAQLTDKGPGPAWPIQELNHQLQTLTQEVVADISKQRPAQLWSRLIQFSGVQITQPILQACGHVLRGRGTVIPHDMITFTVQGQADIFNLWNRSSNEGVRCLDRLYVCIVKYTYWLGDVSYGLRPAVGMANGSAPREYVQLNRDSRAISKEIVHSYFIGTVISQQRIRYITQAKLESVFHPLKPNHPNSLGLQLISINARM